jgi:hypothetical protein
MPECPGRLLRYRMTVESEGIAVEFPVISAGGTSTPLKNICDTVTGFGLWFVIVSWTMGAVAGPVTDMNNTITFSGRSSEAVSAPAHTATAMARATATAMSMTVAMTGLIALREAATFAAKGDVLRI